MLNIIMKQLNCSIRHVIKSKSLRSTDLVLFFSKARNTMPAIFSRPIDSVWGLVIPVKVENIDSHTAVLHPMISIHAKSSYVSLSLSIQNFHFVFHFILVTIQISFEHSSLSLWWKINNNNIWQTAT